MSEIFEGYLEDARQQLSLQREREENSRNQSRLWEEESEERSKKADIIGKKFVELYKKSGIPPSPLLDYRTRLVLQEVYKPRIIKFKRTFAMVPIADIEEVGEGWLIDYTYDNNEHDDRYYFSERIVLRTDGKLVRNGEDGYTQKNGGGDKDNFMGMTEVTQYDAFEIFNRPSVMAKFAHLVESED